MLKKSSKCGLQLGGRKLIPGVPGKSGSEQVEGRRSIGAGLSGRKEEHGVVIFLNLNISEPHVLGDILARDKPGCILSSGTQI